MRLPSAARGAPLSSDKLRRFVTGLSMLRITWQNVEEMVEMSPTIRVWFKKHGSKK